MYWAYMDTNNDGLVTKAEMIAFTESTYQQNALFSSFNATRKEKETTKIENYFRKYDTDKNNQLSRTEIASIPKTNDPLYKQFRYNELFNDLDTNQDGELSYNEFLDGMYDGGYYQIDSKVSKSQKLVNGYDTNNDKKLDFTEVKAFLIDIGYSNPSNNDVNWIISLLDTNLDSKISESEMLNGLQ